MGYSSGCKEGGLCSGIIVISPIPRIAQLFLLLKKNLSLGLFRSDYMIHQNVSYTAVKSYIKQVEFNTIASSFGGLASKVASLHKSASTPKLLTKLTEAAFSTQLTHIHQPLRLPSTPPRFPQTPPSPRCLRVLQSLTGRMVLRNPRRNFLFAFFLWCKALRTTSSIK